MFIGREKELKELNKRYQSNRFEFTVIYGRKHVGKTALINEFCKDKETIFFAGIESSEKQNLENFSRAIYEFQFPTSRCSPIHLSFSAALEDVFCLSLKKRIILVIDEYPYVAKSSEGFSSILQLLIDKYEKKSKLYLILCGSSMSYMVDHVLAYKAPLYGRRTSQLKIEPFNFFETSSYFKSYSSMNKALMYGIVGGTPQCLLQMKDNLSIEENIKNTFLNPSSSLYEEPSNLLKQEVREPALYNAIITAIANGCSKLNEIANKIGEKTSVCATYLKHLILLGIIKKESPYGDISERKTIYSIADNMFRFYYRFVPENTSIINRGAIDLVYKKIEPELSTYMGSIFEDICKQYLWKQLIEDKIPLFFPNLGRWWGNNPKTRRQEEIDIMGSDSEDAYLFCECKWTNELVDLPVLETLIERSQLFKYKKIYYYLFAKFGFTQGCKDKAKKMKNVTLVMYEEMFH